jgi:transcriptional regulator with XRE-family HTH domain
MDYGKAFRVIRAAFGLRQAEMAEFLQISPSLISLIESGKRQASTDIIDSLADALRIPISLIKVLAYEPQDLEGSSNENFEALAHSLLRLLAHASTEKPEPSQTRLPFSDPIQGKDE